MLVVPLDVTLVAVLAATSAVVIVMNASMNQGVMY